MTSPMTTTSFMLPPEITENEMNVTKRNGQLEIVSFDKILQRIKRIGKELDIKLNFTTLAMKVIDQLYDGISTTKIDELTAEQCASMASIHYDYNALAGRIIISSHQKNTSESFSEVMTQLYHCKDKNGKSSPLVSDELMDVVRQHGKYVDTLCDYSRDFLIDYFGFKTLDRAYLMRLDGKTIERPQHMWMRVAIGIHGADLDAVTQTYDMMSQKYFTHATPTLFNAGTPRPQLSSCYLLSMESDSIDGIYNTLKDCALISKMAGGIGLHIHNVRATGSRIRGTNGTSNGIVPMLRVFNNTAKYVDQCISPRTIIYTKDGPKQIQNCTSGETSIFNLLGKTEVIQNVLEHSYNGEILQIDTMHSLFPLIITPMHPLYVLKGQQKGLNYTVIKNRIDKNICNFEWIEAKELSTDDMVIYPIPTYVEDNELITEDDCYMYGVILGDGCMNNSNDTGYVSMHTTNKLHIRTFMQDYFDKKLVEYKVDVKENTTRLRWNRTIHLPFRYNDFYDENSAKRIHPRWLNLPIEKVKYILKGLVDTDGCIDKEIVFDNTSLNLIESLRFICLKMGILTSGYIRDRVGEKHETKSGIIENKKISYCLRIPKTIDICKLFNIDYDEKQFFKFFKYNNFLLSRIQNIKQSEYNGILYDLQMQHEHNYLLTNGLVHNGGGKRNGSFAIYIEPWHADIEMFLQMRKNHGDEELKARDLFYALWIPDLFMERVKTNGKWTLMCPDECPGLSDVYGDEFKKLYESYESDGRGRMNVNARDLWFKMLDAQMETGTPYILYKDAVNKKSNQKNIGTIKSSNLCVAPETLILTNQGHIPIGTLKDQTVQVWNGKEFSEVTVHQTGENQEILDVYTDDGLRLSCTPYHKFYIQSSYSLCSIKKVDANNLQPGDKIIKCQYPIIDGSDNMLYAYTHGFFCGDGTYRNVSNIGESPCKFQALENHHFCKRHLFNETDNYVETIDEDVTQYTGNCKAMSYSKLPIIYLYDNKRELVSHIECRLDPIHEEQNKRIVVTLPGDIAEKYEVPPATCSLKTKLEWFAGYCDADGSISINGTNEQLQVASINHEFLTNVKLMLQTCGINPKIKLLKPDGSSYLPDGKGGHKWYVTKAVYRLLITSCDLYQLVSLGFKPHRLVVSGTEPQRNANQFVKILKVVNENRISDTYCFTEPKRNMGIFNGIITGQCTEITEYSDDSETAVCNLASIGLPMFIRPDGTFDYEFLHSVTKVITCNLNKIIDINYYPTEKTKKSNFRHRPIGIGVQGLADVFILMGFPFSSEEAKTTNRHIFETIYHAALEASMELAKVEGSYETFIGSPAHQGILQFDMWDVKPGNQRYDWDELKEQITLHGLRNSLLLAPMPTASTSQILGFNECIEPITSNIYSRRTLAGEFIQANKYLMSDLISINMWNEKIKNNIIANHGSIQQIDGIPDTIKEKYKTVWEIPMRNLIDMAVDRGAFICQSQSLNLWLEDPNYNTLTSMHFYSWSKGLKTGIYYLRRRGKHQAQQFTIEPEKAKINEEHEDDYICEMCSS
jgi:ribonucleoside-diphosphate reductase alpha chain